MANKVDTKYLKYKLADTLASTKRVRSFTGEDRAFKAYQLALDAFYFSIEGLPEEVQADARNVYNALYEVMSEE